MAVSLLLATVAWVVFGRTRAFDFSGTGVVVVNNTVDIAIKALQEDMNFFVFYHTTTRPCSECDR